MSNEPMTIGAGQRRQASRRCRAVTSLAIAVLTGGCAYRGAVPCTSYTPARTSDKIQAKVFYRENCPHFALAVLSATHRHVR